MTLNKFLSALFLLGVVLALSGCISRAEADARLAIGCAAGVELFLPEGFEIKQIKDQIFRDDPEFGSGYREVRLFAVQSDGWYDDEKEFRCIFAEDMAPFGLSHTATIYQLQIDDEIYGKKDGKILGSFEDHLRLTETVEQNMNRR